MAGESLAVTHMEVLMVGIPACPGNSFDGYTLEGQPDQVERITGKVPETTFVDRGYKEHGVSEDRSRVLISGTRRLGYTLKRHLRRRSAVEPEIGHMKADGLLGRNFLKGMQGDAINAVLCGAGHNLRKILARIRLLCLDIWRLWMPRDAVLTLTGALARLPWSRPLLLPQAA